MASNSAVFLLFPVFPSCLEWENMFSAAFAGGYIIIPQSCVLLNPDASRNCESVALYDKVGFEDQVKTIILKWIGVQDRPSRTRRFQSNFSKGVRDIRVNSRRWDHGHECWDDMKKGQRMHKAKPPTFQSPQEEPAPPMSGYQLSGLCLDALSLEVQENKPVRA